MLLSVQCIAVAGALIPAGQAAAAGPDMSYQSRRKKLNLCNRITFLIRAAATGHKSPLGGGEEGQKVGVLWLRL
jgi:hypothetical protein